MSFNIRKLKIKISAKERELRSCEPRSRDRIRGELAALRMALIIARENVRDSVQSRAGRAKMGLRSTGMGDVA